MNLRIVQINSGNFGSTGNIMIGIAQKAREQGHTCYISCPDARSTRKRQLQDQLFIGTRFGRNLHLQLGTMTGFQGLFSIWDTYRYLKELDRIQPDILHFHNLHNCFINLPMLFRYIKKHDIPVVWTLHDCWSFTGGCPYFDMVACDKWKTGCYECPQYHTYPEANVDQSRTMWKWKKKWFSDVNNLTIVTPSQWLADLAKASYWQNHPVKVIHNGIDLTMFHPVKSDFREKYQIPEDKKILLGVAFGWEARKGLDVFLELEKRLDSRQFQIVLVGTDDVVDKLLPDTIISIHRTQNQQELAMLYTAADLFVIPTREENYPTVNMEALACGTPVLTFRTGGSPEIPDETCGCVVDCGDVDAMEREILRLCGPEPLAREACLMRAKGFDRNDRFQEYVDLYEQIGEK